MPSRDQTMAYVTLKHSPSSDSVFGEDSEEHSNVISWTERATDCFIYKDFSSCIEVCCRAISRTKCFPECSRCYGATKSLTVLAIQAYAEQNKWDLVLPFVQKVYGNVESCPARVMQLCLLLHARVKQFVQCHAMAKIWLQCNANYSVSSYFDVAELYVYHILVPLGAYNLIPQFVEGCSVLTSEEKLKLLSPLKESKECEKTLASESSSEHSHKRKAVNKEQLEEKHSSVEKRFEIIRTLCYRLQVMTRWKDSTVYKVFLMITIGALALIYTHIGNAFCWLDRAIKVWEAAIRTWNRICGT